MSVAKRLAPSAWTIGKPVSSSSYSTLPRENRWGSDATSIPALRWGTSRNRAPRRRPRPAGNRPDGGYHRASVLESDRPASALPQTQEAPSEKDREDPLSVLLVTPRWARDGGVGA